MSAPRRSLAGLLAVVVLTLLLYYFGQRENSESPDPAAPAPIAANVEPTALPPPTFPAADLRSALTEVCSGNVAESAYLVLTKEEIQAATEILDELKSNLSERLSVSSTAEHLHMAALLEDDPGLRIELLERAIAKSPSDPFLIWGAVQMCSEAIEFTRCPLREWERLLIAADGQNSESWIRVAANRYAANDVNAALEAMRHASTAAESRTYWTETIEMSERGLAAASDLAFPERVAMAFGFAGAGVPYYQDYVSMCEERSSQSVDWAYACLAYGELLEAQGKTEIGAAVALSIQRVALQGLGDVDQTAKVKQRIEARRQAQRDSTKDFNPTATRLIFSNPAVYSAYLAAIRSDGEEAAQRQIAMEIERLIEERPDLACEQARAR